MLKRKRQPKAPLTESMNSVSTICLSLILSFLPIKQIFAARRVNKAFSIAGSQVASFGPSLITDADTINSCYQKDGRIFASKLPKDYRPRAIKHTGEGLASFDLMWIRPEKIQSIELRRIGPTEQSHCLLYIEHWLRRTTQLTRLTLQTIPADASNRFLAFLSSTDCKWNLQTLELTACREVDGRLFSDLKAVKFATSPALSTLQNLYLLDTPFPASALPLLAKTAPQLSVFHLDLQISREDTLSTLLRSMPNLTELVLAVTEEEEAEDIAELSILSLSPEDMGKLQILKLYCGDGSSISSLAIATLCCGKEMKCLCAFNIAQPMEVVSERVQEARDRAKARLKQQTTSVAELVLSGALNGQTFISDLMLHFPQIGKSLLVLDCRIKEVYHQDFFPSFVKIFGRLKVCILEMGIKDQDLHCLRTLSRLRHLSLNSEHHASPTSRISRKGLAALLDSIQCMKDISRVHIDTSHLHGTEEYSLFASKMRGKCIFDCVICDMSSDL